MRSKLFVPASRPEFFEKALRSAADAISFDLEDAVAPQHKQAARTTIAAMLSGIGDGSGKKIIVRINAVDTGLAEPDLSAVTTGGLEIVNIPKVESAETVLWVAAELARLEQERGIYRPIRILPNIETPKGVRLAAEIAAAHPRVCGLQLGFADLFVPLAIDRGNTAAVNTIRLTVRMAAAEAGVPAYDGAYVDVADTNGFEVDARNARGLGFDGKSCIHPSQIAIANDVFGSTDAEVSAAHRIIDAAIAQGEGKPGAFILDGTMIDRPFIDRAKAVLDRVAQERSNG